MHFTIERLISDDENILIYYKNAQTLWTEILSQFNYQDSYELAQTLTDMQLVFEKRCGGRWIGQEIMVITGIAQFYTIEEGFGENLEKAKLIYKAITLSYCSMEVKGIAEEVAKSYFLKEA
ncbi:TPA: hypothetical protein ACGRPM_004089 [Proteus mirabilis]|uniref:hypothetical protein n=1 Tax=Morganellaceae TaxID=1903414 RepID=UPI001BA365D4|nr:hypothetical protein [Proteus mirabilis]EJD6501506.1 hypothetical protein [Providencia rettgeri]EKU5664886.1 hypothetical protein [Morganella morganii]EKU5692192.1 hypothetical protein [Morganella morganii]ELM3939492.1 hypothetical protein [Providencia rettgeri]EMA4647300.1 hypothetical protein [Providencia rettgeri]